jgi:hypothetical protein
MGANNFNPSALPAVTVEQPCAEVTTCRGPSWPLCTPSWVGGQGGYL